VCVRATKNDWSVLKDPSKYRLDVSFLEAAEGDRYMVSSKYRRTCARSSSGVRVALNMVDGNATLVS
jgi:hypothetical protein